MEHLKHLARQFDGQFNPTITAHAFMIYVKEHKDEIKPFVNEAIWVTNNSFGVLCFSSLLCMVGYYRDDDQKKLVEFLLREFDGVIDINIDHEHGVCSRSVTDSVEPLPFNYTLEIMLADHSKFDVNLIIRDSNLFGVTVLEKILAKADPNKAIPADYSNRHTISVAHEYVENPIKTQRRLYLKYYGERDACRIFILALFLKNKYLCD